MSATRTADILIIGGGIAGASLAGRLAARGAGARVVTLEMEDRPGYHATGRSAANYEPSFGPPVIQALTRASGAFFHAPPDGFAPAALVSPRGSLMLGYSGDDALLAKARQDGYREIARAEALSLVPLLNPDGIEAYLLDEAVLDVDVDALHQGFLRMARRAGGELVCRAEVEQGQRRDGVWCLRTRVGAFAAPVVVNAAGAWADVVAARLGIAKAGVVPKRRSAAILPAPAPDVMRWPQIAPAREPFYIKPTGGKLMLSPADAEPCEPHDAWADDMRLAEAAEALSQSLRMEVTRVERTWGGLRTFMPDGKPIVGYEPAAEGYFWLAGQGGYGIQTAPALADLAASLLLREPLPTAAVEAGVRVEALAPRGNRAN